MKRHLVYIITNSNRVYLEVGYCADYNSIPKLNNVVYIETFNSKEKAQAYQQTLRHFTRMQREKLIRLKNPNWLNLCTGTPHVAKRPLSAYATNPA